MAKTKSKYRSEYCDKLIAAGAKGESLISVLAEIGISAEQSYVWAEKYPKWRESIQIHRVKACAFWEKIGLNIMVQAPIDPTTKKTGNPKIWMFFMKARFSQLGYGKDEISNENEATGFDV